MTREFRFALRQLVKHPGFTALVVLTLALGIGAITAIFSVIDALLSRPLPFRDPNQLVWLYHNKPSREWLQFPLSTQKLEFWREHSRSFEELGLAGPIDFYLGGEGAPELLRGLKVTANLNDLLGVQPLLGRSFRPEENLPGAPRVALLSHRLWRRRFAGDPKIVGHTIRQYDQSYMVVGVLPPQLKFPIGPMPAWRVLSTGEPDLWLPASFIPPGQPDGEVGFAVARLKSGVSAPQAQAEMRVVTQQHERAYPATEGWSVDVVPLREQVAGRVRPVLFLLFGAVGAVLLIACVNTTNLLLARAMNRRKEFAVRSALGAGRLQLIRQLLVESMLLTGLGGLLGVLLAVFALRTLRSLNLSLPLADTVQLNVGVLAFTSGVSLLAGLLSGLAPAWHVWRQNFGGSLQNLGQSSAGHFRKRGLRQILVTGQVTLSLVLLVAAGLLVRSFSRLVEVDPGYKTEGLLTMNLSLASPKYPTGEAKDAFVKTLLGRIEGIPGVSAAGFSFGMPLAKGVAINKPFKVKGRTDDDSAVNVRLRIVSPGYFAAMGIPFRQGKGFSAPSRAATDETQEVILNESAARRAFPGEDPLGQRCNFGHIIGIVGDTLETGLDQAAEPQFYVVGYSAAEAFLVVRSTVAPDAVKAALAREIALVDGDLPVHNLQTMDQRVGQSLAMRGFQTSLLTAFSVVALFLTAMGVYGVIAHGVSQRTQEMGVRMALGAQVRDVIWLVLRDGMKPVMAGIALGTVASAGLTRFMASQLFGVTATDPATFAGVWTLLLAAAAAACWLPAKRAAGIHPLEALRHE